MKKVLQATIDAELWDALKAQAEEENRTMSNLVETLLYKAISDQTSLLQRVGPVFNTSVFGSIPIIINKLSQNTKTEEFDKVAPPK